jgi:hypothetical protein
MKPTHAGKNKLAREYVEARLRARGFDLGSLGPHRRGLFAWKDGRTIRIRCKGSFHESVPFTGQRFLLEADAKDDFVAIARCPGEGQPITGAPVYLVPAKWLAQRIEERHQAYLRRHPNIDAETKARTFFWKGQQDCPRHGLAELLEAYRDAWHLLDAPTPAPAQPGQDRRLDLERVS